MAMLSGKVLSKSVRHSLHAASRAQQAAYRTRVDNELAGPWNDCLLDLPILASKVLPLLL